MAQTVLFVDDEERVLQGLQRMLRPMRDEWAMTFVTDGPDALRVLADGNADVLGSDMRMPGMDGAEVLRQAMRISPGMVRIALSGESDPSMRLRCAATAHQYIAKPCDPEILKRAITRSCNMRDSIDEPPFRELVTGIGTLPCSASAYERLTEELERGRPELESIADIVVGDISMAAKVLQLVNSAFFIAARPIVSPRRAVLALGVQPFHSLVQLRALRPGATTHDGLRRRALATRDHARTIAMIEGWSEAAVEEAEASAMLLDIGELVLGSLSDGLAPAVLAADMAEWDAIRRRTIEANHAAVGASLLASWGIADGIVRAVRDHHSAPLQLHAFETDALLRVADALGRETMDGAGSGAPSLESLVPPAWHSRLELWRGACRDVSERAT